MKIWNHNRNTSSVNQQWRSTSIWWTIMNQSPLFLKAKTSVSIIILHLCFALRSLISYISKWIALKWPGIDRNPTTYKPISFQGKTAPVTFTRYRCISSVYFYCVFRFQEERSHIRQFSLIQSLFQFIFVCRAEFQTHIFVFRFCFDCWCFEVIS